MNIRVMPSSVALRGMFAVPMARIGRTEDHAQGVAGDQQAGVGNTDTEVAGDIGQQAP